MYSYFLHINLIHSTKCLRKKHANIFANEADLFCTDYLAKQYYLASLEH